MFQFRMLKPIISKKSVMCQTENEKFTKAMSQISRTDSLAFKERNLGCTVIHLLMKIKPFKGVNTKA